MANSAPKAEQNYMLAVRADLQAVFSGNPKGRRMMQECYDCKYRGEIPGDCHSKCDYPGLNNGLLDMFADNTAIRRKLNIKGNPQGIRHGWFMWPCNFDPTWLENCDGFKQKEGE